MVDDRFVITEIFEAPPEKVWKAITDKNQMKEWYFDIPDFELKVGHTFNFHEPGNEKKFHHVCKITEIVPGVRFQHTWTYPGFNMFGSVVTWNLEKVDNGTRVTLTHLGLDNFKNGGDAFKKENFEAGWNEIVKNQLNRFLNPK